MRNPLLQDTFLFYCGRDTIHPDVFIRVHDRPAQAWFRMNKLLGSADYMMFHHSEIDTTDCIVKDIDDLIIPLGDSNG